jgi:hypothetical protein
MALEITENNMADQILPEMQDITRQRDLARLLLQRGMADNLQGQMVSGRYVGASPLQGIANVYSAYKGSQKLKEADRKQQELAEMIRQQGEKDFMAYGQAVQGTPEQTVYGAGMEGPTMDVTSAVAPDYTKGLSILRSSKDPENRALAKMLMADQLKTQKLGEGESLVRGNLQGGFTSVGQGAEKFRAPIQVDTGTSIEFRDAKDPTKVLQVVPKSQAGQVVEREDGTYLVDTRTGQARPVMGQQGQALVGGKPMTESQSNATAFGMRAAEANNLLKNIENSGTTTTGGIRTVVSGTLGAIPLVGENLESKSYSALNFLSSADQQKTDQARRNFITAILRKESGAAIAASEFANEEKKYFPQIGDSDKVIKQKQQARDLAIKALEVQAGPTGARSIKAQQNAQLSPQDMEALNWANSNPNDPRSAQIKQRLGR